MTRAARSTGDKEPCIERKCHSAVRVGPISRDRGVVKRTESKEYGIDASDRQAGGRNTMHVRRAQPSCYAHVLQKLTTSDKAKDHL